MATSLADVAKTLAENLRDGCLGAYSDISGAPKPTPQGVIHHDGSIPTIDCGDLLIVMVSDITTSFQGPPEQCVAVPSVSLSATITRCVPNLVSFAQGIAEQTDYTTAAELLAQDASTIWHGVMIRCQQGALWTGFNGLGCADTQFRDMRPGAFGGIGWFTWQLTVHVTAPLV